MVDAGNVRIHVDLDASALGTKLTEAVHRALRPALAEAHRQVAALNAELNKVKSGNIGRTAKEFDKVAASAKNAANEAQRWRDRTGRMHDVRTGRFVGGAGGGGSGGGGGGRQNYTGVLGQANLLLDRFVARMGLAGAAIGTITPLIGALGGAVGVLGGGIGVAVGGIGQLTAGISALVPAIVGVVAAVKIGFAGLKDGAKAYMKQFEDANAVISAQIGNMMGPMLTAWQEVSARIKLDFAQALVPTFNNLGALIRAIGPALSGINQAFASLANSITAQLLAAAPQINAILAGSKTLLATITPGIQMLLKGFLDLSAAAQRAMPIIGGAISGTLSALGAAFSRVAATPEFQQALHGFAQMIAAFGGLLAGLIPVLTNLGAQVGPQFAQMLTALGTALTPLLQAFGTLATTLGPTFNAFLVALGPVLAQLVLDLGRLGEMIGPYLVPLLTGLGAAIHSAIEPIGQAGVNLANSLTMLVPAVGQLLAAIAGPLAAALPSFGTLLKVIADLIVAAAPILIPLGQAIGTIAQALSTALQPLIPVINQLATALAPLITQLGTSLANTLIQLGPSIAMIAQNIVSFLLPNLPGLLSLLDVMLQVFVQIAQVLAEHPGLINAVLIAFGTWQAITVVDAVLTGLTGMRAALMALPEAASLAGTAMTTALGPVGIILAGLAATAYAIWDAIQGIKAEQNQPGSSRLAQHPLGKIGDWLGITGGGGGKGGPPVPPIPGVPPPTAGPHLFPYGGGASPDQPPWLKTPPAQTFAPPGPSTPVAPDIKGTKPGQQPISPDDLPLDVVAKTPEQIKLLTDIRALLAGTGNSNSPLNSLKDMQPAVAQIAADLKKTLPPEELPPGSVPGGTSIFGTPIAPRHPGYEAAAAALQAFGVKPETVIGTNPIDYALQQRGKRIDAWQTQTNQQIQAWQQAAKQPPPMTPQQMGALPGMPQGWQATNLPPQPGGASLWDKVAQAESSGVWNQPGGGGIGPGGVNPPRGGLQIKDQTWAAFGGTQFAPTAAQATREQQIEIANRIAFSGYQGTQPQGLGAWQVITEGKVPGVTTQTPAGAFGGGGAATAPGLPGPNIGTGVNPVPVWVVGSGPMPTTAAGVPGAVPGGSLFGVAPMAAPGGAPMQLAPGVLRDTGNVPTGAQGQYAAALINQMFGITGIGGSRPPGTAAPGTHDIGQTIDVPISNPALGDQINQYLQQNAAQLGIDYTIWRDQGRNLQSSKSGAAGSTFTVPGHQDHIDVQFTGGGPPGQVTPAAGGAPFGPTAPGVPGANIATGAAPIPVNVMNWPGMAPGGAGGLPLGVKPLVQGLGQGAGQAAGQAAGDIVGALPAALPSVPAAPAASYQDLVKQGNPLAFAAMAGFNVPDYSRFGGVGAGAVTAGGPEFDASGRLFSDTAALLDRTFTSLSAQIEAMKNQLLAVLREVVSKLDEKVLKPTVQGAVTKGFEGISDRAFTQQGTAIGEAAAPPIGDAVAASIDSGTQGDIASSVMSVGSGVVAGLFDEGGEWPSGTIGANLSGSTERVLSPTETMLWDTARGGSAAFATAKGVIGNETVGAEWFGVSQIPIIGAIVNMLIKVLLKVIGVDIEVRDTLQEMTDDFRGFRGDAFKAFDAQGRLLNDTSAMIDRSYSSEQVVAEERIRILKIVLQALIKWLIEKIIVPIAKAMANTLINAASSAAGGAAGAFAPGSGGAVTAGISTAGNAAVDILAEVGTEFGVAMSSVLIDALFSGAQSIAPDLMGSLFGGGMLGGMLGPFGNIFGSIMGMLLAIPMALLGGMGSFGSMGNPMLGTLGGLFDDGGVATGPGYLPKATISPERVLSPQQTSAFDRMVSALESGNFAARTTTINAPFTVTGGREGGEAARDRLLELLS